MVVLKLTRHSGAVDEKQKKKGFNGSFLSNLVEGGHGFFDFIK